MKNKIIKVFFLIVSILLVIPSIIYLIVNKNVIEFNTYYNFFINNDVSKFFSTIIYLLLFTLLTILYLMLIRKKNIFNSVKDLIKYTAIVGTIFLIMLPWTSSDVFYYMGVGELDCRYNQNPYYVTMKDYYEQNKTEINDEILEKGAFGYWGGTTVVYGPIAQLIFKISSFISIKNVTVGLFIYKIINLIIHIANTYLIYKVSGKMKFTTIYGLNPFVMLEFIGNVHNDIIVVFFLLLTLYFLLKKKKLLLSIFCLALATGIKYFSILLLPIIILYHFRDEKKLSKRFLRCLQYGTIFLIIFALEYVMYFKDYQVIVAMFAQTSKYAKSIYSVILQYNRDWLDAIRAVFLCVFIIYYFVFCINLLTTHNIKFYRAIKKYNVVLILFLLILTSFQQWYLVWLFATIMWQRPNMIRNTIGLTACTEIANSAYMFLFESYKFDDYFVGLLHYS